MALAIGGLLLVAGPDVARAQQAPANEDKSRASQPEEEDFGNTPFTEYGEFNSDKDEEEDARFFQYGRFFGVSLGLGFDAASGNRGVLWQGGFPLIDFKLHYWFDFNLALDMGVFAVSHFYDHPNNAQIGRVDVNIIRLGVDVKYYFDTKDLSAPISFANPYILAGFGSYAKTETSAAFPDANTKDTTIGLAGGAGLEFAIKPKKVFFAVEGKIHLVKYADQNSQDFKPQTAGAAGVDDLSGYFYTVTGHVLFTW